MIEFHANSGGDLLCLRRSGVNIKLHVVEGSFFDHDVCEVRRRNVLQFPCLLHPSTPRMLTRGDRANFALASRRATGVAVRVGPTRGEYTPTVTSSQCSEPSALGINWPDGQQVGAFAPIYPNSEARAIK